MRKEILTDEKIKLDIPFYRAQCWEDVTNKFLHFFIPFAALGILLTLVATWKIGLPFLAVAAIFLVWYIIKLQHTPKTTEPVYASYTVVKDRLVNIVEETVEEYNHRQSFKTVTVFYFSSQSWRVPPYNYQWSDLYHMSGTGLCNTSLIGDEFYLVLLNDTHEICCVYNTKLFEYKTNLC